MRWCFGIGLHAVFSGLVGYGIGRALWGPYERSRAWRFGQVFGWGFAGFALHFLWNISWPEPAALFAMATVWVAGVAVLATCFYREEKALRQVEGDFSVPYRVPRPVLRCRCDAQKHSPAMRSWLITVV